MIPRNLFLATGSCQAVEVKGGETPEECAVREVDEELGLEINQDDLEVVDQQDRGNHTVTFFRIKLSSLKSIKKVGNEQEEIKIFNLADIPKLPDLFPNHKYIIGKELISKNKL